MRVITPQRRDLTALVVLVTVVLAVSVAWMIPSDSRTPSLGSEAPAPTPQGARTEAESRRFLNAAWAAETNRRLNAERFPNQLAAIYGAPHDDPDAILLRFIAAQNAIQGSLGLNFATGGSG